MTFYDQSAFDIRCKWGAREVAQLAPISEVVIIVERQQQAMALGLRSFRQAKDGMMVASVSPLKLGAGALLSYLQGNFSPEAESAIAAYRHAVPNLNRYLKQCSSGKELIDKGFETDVALAAEFNVSEGVPILRDRPTGIGAASEQAC